MVSEKKRKSKHEYSDLILVDLLHLDRKHFFKRYRVDFFGFLLFLSLMLLVILGTYLLKGIGG
jgi:hypothetical protein